MELILTIATIASPIVGVIAIIVALRISKHSSKDAQQQIDELHNLLEVFIASQTPAMLDACNQLEDQLKEINEQIDDAEEEYNVVNPFYDRGPRIEDIDYEQNKKAQKQTIEDLKKQRKAIETKIMLIKEFLKRKS